MPATVIAPYTSSITTRQTWPRKAMVDLWERRNDLLGAEEIDHLDRLYKSRTGTGFNQSQTIVYKTSAKSEMGRHGYGRLYGTGGYSLERVPSDIRGTLCRALYHDIDIVNCHPVILQQLAAHYNRDLPLLGAYISRRDECLAELQTAMGGSRGMAKAEILKVLFGGGSKQPTLTRLGNEIRTFATFLSTHEDWAEIYGYAAVENRLFSFLSGALQTIERTLLLAMMEHITTLGWQVDVLAYDGFMVRRRTDTSLTADTLAAVAAHVKEATGYEISLTEKPMSSLLPETPVTSEADSAYADMKARFEQTAYYFDPTNTVVVNTPKHGIRHYTAEHARDAFNVTEWSIPSAKEDETFIKRWLKDPTRRVVYQMVYKMPADCAVNEASLFTGFAYKEMSGEDPTAVDLFTDILRCVAGDSEDVTEYILRYAAHIIQRPFEVPGTSVIFSSNLHGTGKDTFVGILRRIIGRHASHYTSNDHFWDKHDTQKEGALLLHLEEAGATAAKAKASELKALITADTISVNPKGLRAYTVPNMGRLFMTTNEADPLKLEQSDRRFLLVNPSGRLHAKGLDWWASIQPQLKSEAFIGTIGRYLETVVLDAWNPRVMPMTELKAELLELSKPNEELFLDYLAASSADPPIWLSATDLYHQYRAWWTAQGMSPAFMAISGAALGKRLLPYKDKRIVKRLVHGVTMYRLIV
jgi:hypothetical protein